ncbi:hypothetical protein LshimejAT787_1101080 [Lyophyllum shimeji]|uniref:Uncharacterized protein n=1 Tax=Lyophyllum shimeji TaxID=47721 RepID=A0A9P3PV22_LYOSH|nr:hypothetical protein LshimejAT787_1101080 [Lyophyllum shimeji]
MDRMVTSTARAAADASGTRSILHLLKTRVILHIAFSPRTTHPESLGPRDPSKISCSTSFGISMSAKSTFRTNVGQTPLHYAADGGKFLVPLFLLERPTDELLLENGYGQTPLAAPRETVAAVWEKLAEEMPNPSTIATRVDDACRLQSRQFYASPWTTLLTR